MSEQQPAAPGTQGAADTTQPIFNIEKIYMKDMSLECPGAPKVFLTNETPQVNVEVHSGAAVVEAGAPDLDRARHGGGNVRIGRLDIGHRRIVHAELMAHDALLVGPGHHVHAAALDRRGIE